MTQTRLAGRAVQVPLGAAWLQLRLPRPAVIPVQLAAFPLWRLSSASARGWQGRRGSQQLPGQLRCAATAAAAASAAIAAPARSLGRGWSAACCGSRAAGAALRLLPALLARSVHFDLVHSQVFYVYRAHGHEGSLEAECGGLECSGLA